MIRLVAIDLASVRISSGVVGFMQLQEVPGLVERMAALMCVDVDVGLDGEGDDEGGLTGEKACAAEIVEMGLKKVQERGDDVPVWLELEELDINDDMLLSLDLSAKFPVCYSCNIQH